MRAASWVYLSHLSGIVLISTGLSDEVGNVTPFGLELRQPWGRDACGSAALFKMDW